MKFCPFPNRASNVRPDAKFLSGNLRKLFLQFHVPPNNRVEYPRDCKRRQNGLQTKWVLWHRPELTTAQKNGVNISTLAHTPSHVELFPRWFSSGQSRIARSAVRLEKTWRGEPASASCR